MQTLPFDDSWPLRKLSLGIAELNAEGPRVDVESFEVADLPSVVRYEGGSNDHFRAHQDVGPSQSTRKLTFVLQLSDPSDYRGGALVFPEVGHSAEMTRGELVVFPSYLRHVVTPVLTGTRLALIGWVHGPAFR
ncbi:2OG-Fe(II) oxygenase [Dermatobacter hominis]|uniref:2OG-Fe(II) oxygenase n=1 Tax=Dermatobacter hominis TaxID=2884263 RepID=UPI001D10C304|nr:2OG-Fe(II) oxygenase [Dermatobacter hominis]UDY33947.1 2OG-Fe(II) oxygenase [Dermatobacter hominis]